MDDLPPEARNDDSAATPSGDWESGLRAWAAIRLGGGESGILELALARFERALIETALDHSGGRRQDAARRLGWGRNTLSRKIKEHQITSP